MFIRNLFGKKPTLRTIAQAWNKTFPGVKMFADRVESALYQAARAATGLTSGMEALGKLDSNPTAKQKFIDKFEEIMNSTKSRGDKMDMDPERQARKMQNKKDIDKAAEDAAKGA